MSNELIAVIIGGLIGIGGSLTTTLMVATLANRRRTRAIRAIAKGEIVAIKEKAERFLSGQSSKLGLGASKPMLTSIASELGFLSEDQVVALRRAVTLDVEMRKEESQPKAELTIQACKEALRTL